MNAASFKKKIILSLVKARYFTLQNYGADNKAYPRTHIHLYPRNGIDVRFFPHAQIDRSWENISSLCFRQRESA